MAGAGTEIASCHSDAMGLIYRRFHAGGRPGLLPWLEAAGRAMIGPPPSGILLGVTENPDEVIWVGDRGADADFLAPGDATPPPPPWVAEILAGAPAWRLAFVDQWYRRPAPAHRVWVLEADAPAGWGPALLQPLLRSAPGTRRPAEVVGWTIYRTVESPARHVGFVGVAGVQPEWNPGEAGGTVWRPLLRISRIPAARPADGAHAPRPADRSAPHGSAPPGGIGPPPPAIGSLDRSDVHTDDRVPEERSASREEV